MYTCQNKTCAIAINKAEFPVMMNCPVCQKPLVSEQTLSSEEIDLLQSLPYVIAYPLKQALLEPHAWTRINLLKDTFLNYLKYLGLLTASEFFNSPFKERKIVDLFQQNLAQPSFGSWNAFTRECLQYLKNKNHSFFCDDLVAYYETIETSKKRKLYTGEIEVTDSSNSGKIHYVKQQATAIGMLINFRNRYLGHGLTLDTATSEKLWNEYFPVFRTLLEQLTFCKKFPMLKQESSQFYALQGVEILPFDVKEKPLSKVSIYNINTGKSMPVIPFFIIPGELAIDKEDKSNIFSYESNTGVRITFFSPEGDVKDASGKLLDKLQFLLRDKQKEIPYSPDALTKELFLERIADENKIALKTLIDEKKVIEGIYQHREEMEIKLREWIGARANIFFIAAEAGSGKTNLLVEMQKQYAERNLASLFIRASRMEKTSLKEELAYQLNLDPSLDLSHYKFLAGTQAEPTFILIDGLNEAHYAERIWQEILEISALFEPGSLKFVITSRANSKSDLGRYANSESQMQYLYGENKDHEATLASSSFWLTPLDMKEMEGAWENYVAKDKKRFKPLFSFNDIATFDRGLYLQLNNPLGLRIFLETYNGKKLPKKGIKHLHVWKDWFATFTDEEQKFMRLLADAVWEKGENELLLDDVLHNQNLQPYFLTDTISAPYQRLLTMGWISRYVKDLTIYVSFTVEGVLLYLLGTKLNQQNPALTSDFIGEILNTGAKLQKSAIESFLCEQALEGKMNLIVDLIDEGDEKLELCVTPLLYFLKSQGVERTLEILLENPTDNDWVFLNGLQRKLNDVVLITLRAELLRKVMDSNPMKTENEILLGLESLEETASDNMFQKYFSRLNFDAIVASKNQFILKSLASLEHTKENYDRALECYQKCLAIELEMYGENHSDVGTTYNNMGLVFWEKNELDKAIEYHQKSLDISLKIYGEYHGAVASSYNNLGLVYYDQAEFDIALEYYKKCLAIELKVCGEQHPLIAIYYNNIGDVFSSKGDLDKAIEYHQKCLAIRLKALGELHPDVITSYRNIGLIFRTKGELDSALKFLQKSLMIELEKFGEKDPVVARSYMIIANCFYDKEELGLALDYAQKSLTIMLKSFGEQDTDLCIPYFLIGNCYFKGKQFEKAIEYFLKAFSIKQQGGYAFRLGACYEAINKSAVAFEFYTKCAEIRKDNLGISDDATQEAIVNAKRLEKELGKELPEWF